MPTKLGAHVLRAAALLGEFIDARPAVVKFVGDWGMAANAPDGVLVMGAKAGPGDGHFRQIIAEGITIVDGAGQELILIGFRKDAGAGIRILNKAGKRVLGIGIAADEGGSGILVADKEGSPRVGLGMDEGVPSLVMINERGKKT